MSGLRSLICAITLVLGCGNGSPSITAGSPDSPAPDSPLIDGPQLTGGCGDAGQCRNGGRCSSSGGVPTCVCLPADVWGGADCGAAIGAEVVSVSTIDPPIAGALMVAQATLFDPGGVATSIDWSFGDGATVTDSALERRGSEVVGLVAHTFVAPGNYTIAAATTVAVTNTSSTIIDVGTPIGSCPKSSWTVTAPGFQYAFDGNAGNPGVVVCLGQKMTFHLDSVSPEHPFCIWNANDQNAPPGVVNNCSVGSTDVVWNVPASLPNGARYRCNIHLFGSAFAPK